MDDPTDSGFEPTDSDPLLTAVEARILGALMEKQRTTPDYYPLTLNALVQACNQKTSRDPVMQLTQGEVGHSVNQLRDRELVRAGFHGRAERYEQRLTGQLKLDRQETAALCVLMLRGPQTLGEIRTNSARMAEFDDLSAVGDALESLMSREPPLVACLPRSAGRREERFAHLLCGEPDLRDQQAAEAIGSPAGGASELAQLRQEIQRLRAELDRLWQLTGLADQRPATGPDND